MAAAKHYVVAAPLDIDEDVHVRQKSGLDEFAYRGARHVVTENVRTLAMSIALADANFFPSVYDANLFAAIFDAVEDRLRSSATGLIVAYAYVFGALTPVAMGMLKDLWPDKWTLTASVFVRSAGVLFWVLLLD